MVKGAGECPCANFSMLKLVLKSRAQKCIQSARESVLEVGATPLIYKEGREGTRGGYPKSLVAHPENFVTHPESFFIVPRVLGL